MARQVVSYDDLDTPLSTTHSPSIQKAMLLNASDIGGASGGSVTLASHREFPQASVSPAASPPQKKRKREDGVTEGSELGHSGQNQSGAAQNSTGGAHSPSRYANTIAQQRVSNSNANRNNDANKKNGGKNKRRRNNRERQHDAGPGGQAGQASPSRSSATGPSIPVQHWDDPGTQAAGLMYDEGTDEVTEDAGGWGLGEQYYEEECYEDAEWEGGYNDVDMEDEEVDEEDESRDLTHEEIWDDSALVAAWDAANEEYEVIHGKSKRWKTDRVHKSPLWYNVPPERSQTKNKGKGKSTAHPKPNGTSHLSNAKHQHSQVSVSSAEATGGHDNQNSKPLDFSTYIPTHDASLSLAPPPQPPPVPLPTRMHLTGVTSYYSTTLAGSEFKSAPNTAPSRSSGATMASADEAFERALGAMYWCGYWTAVYHAQRSRETDVTLAGDVDIEEGRDNDVPDAQEEKEQFVSTQR